MAMPPSRGSDALLAQTGLLVRDDRQLIRTVIVASLNTFCLGYNTGVIAGVMLYIKTAVAFAHMNDFEQGALVSCILAGATFGAACGPIADNLGRRYTMLLVALLFAITPIVMMLSPNIWVLIVARTVCGVSVGMCSMLVNMYISEISPPECRGRLGGYAPFLGTTGILVAYIVSALFGLFKDGLWRIQLGVAVVPAICLLLLQMFLPETPRWLLAKGRRGEAAAALRLLFRVAQRERVLESRGDSVAVEALRAAVESELDRIDNEVRKLSATTSVGIGTLCRKYRKACFLGVGINVLQQVSGINVVIYFGPTIFTDAGFSKTAAMVSTAIVSIIQLTATAVLMKYVDRVGRRPLAIIGLYLMMFGIACLIGCFVEKALVAGTGTGDAPAIWLSVIGMLIFRAAFSMSLGPLPYIMTSEFFPQEARAVGAGLSWMSNWGSNFVVSQSFPMLVGASKHSFGKSAGEAAIFGMYGFFCVFALVFVQKYLPETAGRSLDAASTANENSDARTPSTRCPSSDVSLHPVGNAGKPSTDVYNGA
jgi:sugar porter (SP) family MFS transporter